MIACTTAIVAPGGVLGGLSCQPPLTVRRVHSDEPDVCALCLVGSAAGPLSGDVLSLNLEVQPNARASLQATGASIAQGRSAQPSRVHLRAEVGAGATLVADPGALIACTGSRVEVAVELDVAASAAVEWHETVVLGRHGEADPGAVVLTWNVRRADQAVLRQRVDLTDPALREGLLAGHRVLRSVLLLGPELSAATVVHSPTAVAQRVDEHAMLVTVLAMDAARATQQTAELLTGLHARVQRP